MKHTDQLKKALRENIKRRTVQKISRNMSTSGQERIKIIGGTPLNGRVKIQGSKNAALPIIAASVINPKNVTLENVPSLADTKIAVDTLGTLGGNFDFQDTYLKIDNSSITKQYFGYDLGSQMRASILFLGSLLARFSYAKIPLPGGCSIGARPVDMHVKAMEALGANITIDHGYITASTSNGLIGGEFVCNKVSVGVTENFITAATLAKGKSRLINAAKEPEIIDLADFLNAMGAKISGAGTSLIEIEGVDIATLKEVTHKIICDRIEAGSYAIATLATKGNVILENIDSWVLESFIEYLKKAGANIKNISSTELGVSYNGTISSIDVVTDVHPGFPTDLQSPWMVLMCLADSKSIIDEQIFENRFNHVPELIRMGADIKLKDHSIALISPIEIFNATEVKATDLRAAFSLIIAGLVSDGETYLSKLHHLDRGYESVIEKLSNLGAKIERGEF